MIDKKFDLYAEKYHEIWQPQTDTCHITSLWRQGDQVYFVVQDWEHEEILDLYRINIESLSNNNSNSNTSPRPNSTRSGRTSSNARAPALSRQGSNNARSFTYDPNLCLKVRSFSLKHDDRVWQLSWLRFEKKFLLGIAACHGGHQPQLIEIPFKNNIKLSPLGPKKILWPTTYADNIPHTLIYHQPTRTWFTFLPIVMDSKSESNNNATANNNNANILDKQYWLQFRLDAARKKMYLASIDTINE